MIVVGYHCDHCDRHFDHAPPSTEQYYYCEDCGHSSGVVPEERGPHWCCVSVYLVDLDRGGPEEGGWYFEYGYPVTDAGRLTKIFRDYDEALIYYRRLNRALDATWNRGRREISSVLSEGRYHARIDLESYPHHYPTERPRYS